MFIGAAWDGVQMRHQDWNSANEDFRPNSANHAPADRDERYS
jgi:hypothetical protein